MSKIAFGTTLLSLASSRMSFGKCPTLDWVTDLDVDRMQGKWYEVEKEAGFPFTLGYDCTFQELAKASDDDLNLKFGAWNTMMLGYTGESGKLYCPSGQEDTCKLNMPDFEEKIAFNILATDYDNYQIMYPCMQMIDAMGVMVKIDYHLIFVRKVLSEEKMNEIRDIIREKAPEYAYDWQLKSYTK